MELQALETAKPQFDKHDASLIAISPHPPPTRRKSVCQNKLTFPILSDAKSEVAAAFSGAIRVPRIRDHEHGSDDVRDGKENAGLKAGVLRAGSLERLGQESHAAVEG